jgi:hypothetical protein
MTVTCCYWPAVMPLGAGRGWYWQALPGAWYGPFSTAAGAFADAARRAGATAADLRVVGWAEDLALTTLTPLDQQLAVRGSA